MTEKTSLDEDKEWREEIESRLTILESREIPKRRQVGSNHRSTVMSLLTLYLALSLVNLFGSVSLSLILMELSPIFAFSGILNLAVGLVGVAFAFALYRLAGDLYQHLSSPHGDFKPQTAVSKFHPLCYICSRPATHRREGKWVCDEHGKPKRPTSK